MRNWKLRNGGAEGRSSVRIVIDRSEPAMAMACWVFWLGSDEYRGATEKAVADLMDLWSRLRRRTPLIGVDLDISRRTSSAPLRSGWFWRRIRRSGVRKRRERTLERAVDPVLL